MGCPGDWYVEVNWREGGVSVDATGDEESLRLRTAPPRVVMLPLPCSASCNHRYSNELHNYATRVPFHTKPPSD